MTTRPGVPLGAGPGPTVAPDEPEPAIRPGRPNGEAVAAMRLLEGAAVRWCLLRGDGTADDGDFDLLVHPADARRAAAVLRAGGFSRLRDRDGRPGRRWVAGPLPGGGWARVEISTRLAFGRPGVSFAEQVLLDRSELVEGLRRPAATDEFWALLFHTVLDHGAVRADHAVALRGLVVRGAARADAALLRSARPTIDPATAERLIEAVNAEAWAEAEATVRALVRRGPAARIAGGAARVGRRIGRLVTGGLPAHVVVLRSQDPALARAIAGGVAQATARPARVVRSPGSAAAAVRRGRVAILAAERRPATPIGRLADTLLARLPGVRMTPVTVDLDALPEARSAAADPGPLVHAVLGIVWRTDPARIDEP